MGKLIKKAENILLIVEKSLLVFLLSSLILFAFLQFVLRECFSSGFLWIDIFLRHLVLWVGFLGAAVATQEKKHFSIDVVKKFIPAKIMNCVNICIQLFALVCLIFLCGAAVKFFKDEVESRSILFTVGDLQVPAAWMDLIIPLGFVLVAIHFAADLIEELFPEEAV